MSRILLSQHQFFLAKPEREKNSCLSENTAGSSLCHLEGQLESYYRRKGRNEREQTC